MKLFRFVRKFFKRRKMYTNEELIPIEYFIRNVFSSIKNIGLTKLSLGKEILSNKKLLYRIDFFGEDKYIKISLEIGGQNGRTLTIYYEGGNIKDIESLNVILLMLSGYKSPIQNEFLRLMDFHRVV